MNNKGADQTAWMRRLICAFVVRLWHKQVFFMTWLLCFFCICLSGMHYFLSFFFSSSWHHVLAVTWDCGTPLTFMVNVLKFRTSKKKDHPKFFSSPLKQMEVTNFAQRGNLTASLCKISNFHHRIFGSFLIEIKIVLYKTFTITFFF